MERSDMHVLGRGLRRIGVHVQTGGLVTLMRSAQQYFREMQCCVRMIWSSVHPGHLLISNKASLSENLLHAHHLNLSLSLTLIAL